MPKSWRAWDLVLVVVLCLGLVGQAQARDRWTELNMGPFYVANEGDVGAARDALTQLEQLRWVLGGLLESKDLPSLWPIRIFFAKTEKTDSSQHVWKNGAYIFVLAPGDRLPLAEVAGLLLDANTPRLPPEVESGLRELCSTIQAKGSRVTWGGPPEHPDLAWARMQLFATKFEYTLSFHIFLTALKGGSGLAAAERNAFGKDPHLLEQEAAANLAAGHWQTAAISGRPLDPKRDFGEHTLDDAIAAVYLADFGAGPEAAERVYKEAVNAGGAAKALGYEGLAQLALAQHQNPKEFLDDAIQAGSKSAAVYVDAADGLGPSEAQPFLKKATILNPLWAEPTYQESTLAFEPADREKLLKEAIKLAPRNTSYLIELAKLQTELGEATAAQGSWLRAEDSAPDEAERARVTQLRVDSEQERLDAADKASRHEREAVHLADEKAQQSEEARIRAAEDKANQALDKASGSDVPDQVVQWKDAFPDKEQEKLQGSLVAVDCLGEDARLTIRTKARSSVQLLLKQRAEAKLTCGEQRPSRLVSISYVPGVDEASHTSGSVTQLQIR